MLTREDLQRLTEIRVREAEVLLEANCPNGAHYLAGYAMECALKACFAKGILQGQFPDRDKVLQAHTHDLRRLLRVSGVDGILRKSMESAAFYGALTWSTGLRYRIDATPESARNYLSNLTADRGPLAILSSVW